MFLQEEDNIKYLYESANAMMPNNNFDESWVSSEIDRKVLEWQKEDNNFVISCILHLCLKQMV